MNDRLARLSAVAAPGMAVFGTVLAGVFWDLGVAVLVLAACALLCAIAALWASLQAVAGNTPMTIDEAITLTHADAADERKRAILRTLKDLELDFGVGKIGRDDYQALVNRYRREAKGLLRASDESSTSVRAAAAAYVAEHQQPLQVSRNVCPGCHAGNEEGAVFCNKCGKRLARGTGKKADGGR
jgi:hypothetical protein